MFRFLYVLVAIACLFFTVSYLHREKVDDKISAIILLVEVIMFVVVENKLFVD